MKIDHDTSFIIMVYHSSPLCTIQMVIEIALLIPIGFDGPALLIPEAFIRSQIYAGPLGADKNELK